MHNNHSPLTLLIAVALAGCDPGAVVVDGNGHAHANGNCNGKNNCNNNEASTLDTDGTGDTLDSGSGDGDGDDTDSTTGVPDMSDSDTSTDTGETTDTGESDTDDPEPMPVLQGCGNGLPFPGDLCYFPQVAINIANARNAAIGDMNGDGHADVAVITASSSIVVYVGNGNGPLVQSNIAPALANANYISVGDVDGDGDLDTVTNGIVVNGNAARVSFNNGAGVLATFTDYFTYSGMRDAILADLDEDGDLDLAHSHEFSKKVVVRKNNGLGSFGPQTTYDVDQFTSSLRGVIAADMDDDGARDLVVGTNTLPVILYNSGNGTFDGVAEQTVNFGTGNISMLTVDDYDLDGHLDIAAPRTSQSSFRVVYGLGQRMFDPMWLDFPSVLQTPTPVISADFDVDGNPDIATANDGTGQIGIFRGDGAGAFYDAVVFAAKTEAAGITSGDLNEDGVLDIVMTSDAGTPGLSVLLSNP
jgi:hypothetical protein